MNIVQTLPVISFATIAGLLSAGWFVLVENEVFAFMADLASLNAFVYLLIPIFAAWIAQRFTTSLASPNLPVGTIVNAGSDLPTSKVVAEK